MKISKASVWKKNTKKNLLFRFVYEDYIMKDDIYRGMFFEGFLYRLSLDSHLI